MIYYNNNKTMISYYLKYRKNTKSKKQKVLKTTNERIMVTSNCAFCSIKKPRFIKEQEASGLLSSWGIRTSLSQSSLVSPILF